MTLFLPFTPVGEATERRAIEVKRHLRLGTYEAVDPFAALPAVPARLISIDDFPEPARRLMVQTYGDDWSAIGYGQSPITGEELILVNPGHHEHRRRASLMEEIVHVVLKHPRVRLEFDGKGKWQRPFDHDVEDEAYNVGAACVIPYRTLFYAIRDRAATVAEIAAEFGVSEQYVEFRIKRAGLHRMYRKRCG